MPGKFPLVSTVFMVAAAFATHQVRASEGHAAGEIATVWPEISSPVGLDPAVEKRIDRLMAAMSIEEKVGQVIQGEIQHVTPKDIRKYHLGSVLNGGGSFPNKNKLSTPADWVAMADAFYDASMDDSDGRVGIPVIWGTDAVHGHSNVYGATLFPHNIGLGATRNPELIRKIGEITAIEVAVTGIPWTFAPTLAVVRDDRWGRTYESYSETPEVVRLYAEEMVKGIQGEAGTRDFLGTGHMLATAKHFLGDGGTTGGVDQGNTEVSEQELAQVHGAGYFGALESGAQTVMASFSSWNGEKMHGNRYLLTEVLKGRMGFDGFVVGDWNGHGQVPGCTNDSCAAAFNAGVDMFMAPEDWKALWRNTLAQVNDGAIPMQRLDDAVRRILRVKIRAGLFEKGRPSSWPYAGKAEYLGAPEHRAVARQAVRESLVLLKNNGKILPLDPGSHVLVAGRGAHDIGMQSGGWTLSWQGTGNVNTDFPGATSIFEGIEAAVTAAGGQAVLSRDGSYEEKPDVAIVVWGENPYAEFNGDIVHLQYSAGDRKDLELLRKLSQEGIPVISVFISGRPLWVNPEMNVSDAFVAAWLPGSEGAGVADVLFTAPDGTVRHEFKGRLPFSWPKHPDQGPLNAGDPDYDPLFAYGAGLSGDEAEPQAPLLSEEGLDIADLGPLELFVGRVLEPWGFFTLVPSGRGINDPYEYRFFGEAPGKEGYTWPILGKTDRRVQEDALDLEWQAGVDGYRAIGLGAYTEEAFQGEAGVMENDYSSFVLSDGQLRFDLKRESEVPALVALGTDCTLASSGCGAWIDVTPLLAETVPGEWRTFSFDLGCFAKNGMDFTRTVVPFMLATEGELRVTLSDLKLVPGPTGTDSGPCMPLEAEDTVNGWKFTQ